MSPKIKPTAFPKTILKIAMVFILVFVFGHGSGCHFDSGGLVSKGPDGNLYDAVADRDPQDSQTDAPVGCVEDTVRCASSPSRVERCTDEQWVLDETCDFGCASNPVPHCGTPVFQCGAENSMLDTNSGSFIPGAGQPVVIDTDAITVTGENVPTNLNGIVLENESNLPEILVLTFESVQILAGVQVRVQGSRALALGSKEDLLILGTIDAGGRGSEPGPGGFPGGFAGTLGEGNGRGYAGQPGDYGGQAGGGGAGYLGAGGAGGASNSATEGAGGQSYGGSAITTLVGGSGGGGSSTGSNEIGKGGGGGGAIMLFSRGEVVVGENASINVGGGGGRAGEIAKSGGGGGSGGSLLIEAPRVKILGVLAANGGGGGGSDAMDPSEEHGDDGHPSAQPTAGGNTGGAGGADTEHDGSNGESKGISLTAGGGGGACGRIRINSTAEVVLQEGGAQSTISPVQGDPLLLGQLSVQ